MRAFVLIVALAVITVNAQPAREEKNGLLVVHNYRSGNPCPAEHFYNDCNVCSCSQDGHDADCTRLACRSPKNDDDSDLPHNDAYSQTKQCTPSQQFVDKCNVCTCHPDGIQAACTRALCPPVEKVHIDGYRQGMKCLAGETFYDECNSCKCGSDGVSAGCTLIACPPRPSRVAGSVSGSPNLPHIDNFKEIQECTPDQSFIDVCNNCRCSNDGVHAACTRMLCQPVETPRIDDYQQGRKCPAGKTFRDRCNTCHCGDDGRSAGCTLIACSE